MPVVCIIIKPLFFKTVVVKLCMVLSCSAPLWCYVAESTDRQSY